MNATRIDLLRHGEVEGGERYRGSTDDALSARGWEQMRAAVGDACAWECIISSPLKRCAEFAVELAERHALPLEFDARLQEIHFGAWEGKTAAELLVSHPEHLTRFWNDPVNNPPPEAENLLNFETRVLSAWHEHSAPTSGKRVLIITHGGVIRTIVGHMQGLAWPDRLRIEVPHASVVHYVYGNLTDNVTCQDLTGKTPYHCEGEGGGCHRWRKIEQQRSSSGRDGDVSRRSCL